MTKLRTCGKQRTRILLFQPPLPSGMGHRTVGVPGVAFNGNWLNDVSSGMKGVSRLSGTNTIPAQLPVVTCSHVDMLLGLNCAQVAPGERLSRHPHEHTACSIACYLFRQPRGPRHTRAAVQLLQHCLNRYALEDV
jgi:hypothetical protein